MERYTVEFSGEELCDIREALQQRTDSWERTANYLESGTNDPNDDGPIEEESNPELARKIATNYRRLLDRIAALPVDLEAAPTCGKSWYIAGGRDTRTCGEPAAVVCSRCEKGFCPEHLAEAVYKIDEKPVCENCLEPFELTDETPMFEP
jgi:hypothetical protein